MITRIPGRPAAPPAAEKAAARGVPRADAPLSREQKARLCLLAREAFDRLEESGLIPEGERFEGWRRAEQARAMGCEEFSLTGATQRDFRALRAHFGALKGDMRRAFRDALGAEPETADRELVVHKLREACAECGVLWPNYPESICRTQFRRPLAEATPKQLWSLFFTVRNRRKAKKRNP